MRLKKLIKGCVVTMLAITLTTSPITSVLAYQNSLIVTDTHTDGNTDYGIGDPFVIKYNGMYYLYASTYDKQMGIKVWQSPNMTDWTYKGYCVPSTDATSKGAYAPEVRYYNGKFYLYTATPNGNYHHTYTATSPLGPFTDQGITLTSYDSYGANSVIDGDVFIDDDANATKYFYHSGGNSIEYTTMNDNLLTSKGTRQRLSNLTVNGAWTEGPQIFKRKGKYYATFTGNHVIADNYMIKYAVGNNPTTGLKMPKENMLLINTDDGLKGLGHNSSVIGPDLDSRYIVYHSLLSAGGVPPERQVNIDRLVFNGEKIEALGPTWWQMPDPQMPEFYDYNTENTGKFTSGVKTLSKQSSTSDYTAEFNVTPTTTANDAKVTAIVSYSDDNNFVEAAVTADNKFVVSKTVAGVKTELSSALLPAEYTFLNNLKNIVVKKQGNTFEFYLDERLIVSKDIEIGGGKIGYFNTNCTADYGFTAFSSTVNGNHDKDAIKPSGAKFGANFANGRTRDFEIGKLTDTTAGIYQEYLKNIGVNESVTYKIMPQAKANYSLDLTATSAEGAKVSVYVGDTEVKKDIIIPKATVTTTSAIRGVPLNLAISDVKIKVTEGAMDLYSVAVRKLDDIFEPQVSQSDMFFQKFEGQWTDSNGVLSATNNTSWSLVAYGSEYMGDYQYESTVRLTSGSDAGLMFRLKYQSDASDPVQSVGGCNSADYHYGYYAFITSTGKVALGKQMFNWAQVAQADAGIQRNQDYKLKVVAVGSNFKIYVNGELKINYTDTQDPIMEGKVGMRAFMSTANYTNVSLMHLNAGEPQNAAPTLKNGAISLTDKNFNVYSSVANKGYKFVDGGILFTSFRKNLKGYLKNSSFNEGTLSADFVIPPKGMFNIGLLTLCDPSVFGSGIDDLDGVQVELSRGVGNNLNVNYYKWVNKVWSRIKDSDIITDYFKDKTSDVTTTLKLNVVGNNLTAFVGDRQLSTIDVTAFKSKSTNTAFGFRANLTTDITYTNLTATGVTTTPPDQSVDAVVLDKAEISLNASETYNITATTLPKSATSATVNYTSSNDKIAYVDATGKIIAISEGTAIITAQVSGNIKSQCAVTVKGFLPPPPPPPPPPVVTATSVKITGSVSKLAIGAKKSLIATVNPNNTTDKSIIWKSSDNKIATVSNGKVVAKAVGKVTISATTKNGKKASVTITVIPNKPSNLKVKKSGSKLAISYKKGEGNAKVQIEIYKGGKKYKTVVTSNKSSYKLSVKKGTYKVKIRGYKKIGKTTYASKYTAFKSFKMK